jgi:tetratricopeptide (TPR) repeat protein
VLIAAWPPLTAAAQDNGNWQLKRGTQADCGPVHLIMLPWIKASDKAAAAKAGKDLRDMMRAKFDSREWCLISDKTTDAYLTASQFKTDSVLSDMDAMQLANPVRADVFLQTEVNGFEYSGKLYYVGDDHAWLHDRIPKQDPASSGTQAATFFTGRVKEVLKAYEPTKKCLNANREQKFAEGAAAAQQAIATFPETMVGRICLAAALTGQKKPPAEVLKVVNDVLARDPTSLLLAITQYEVLADTAQYERVAGQFVAIDPGNPAVENIVQRLSDWHRTKAALTFIAKSLETDPANKTLLRIEFRLIYGGGNYKEAIKKGEALAKLDTAAVDSFFVRRMFSAYSNDSQPQKVLAWLKIGTERFPENVSFTIGYAQQLMALNEVPEAIAVYKRLLKTNPNTPEIRLRIANTYNDLGQVDSAYVWLHEAYAHASDTEKPLIAGVAASIASKIYKPASESKSVPDLKKVVPFVAFSDSVSAGDGAAKFLWAYTAYQIATTLAATLETSPSCDVAKEASSWADQIMPLINGGGGKFNQQGAVQLMTAMPKLVGDYLEPWIKAKKCT